jgi:tetratricopeptide (TPR) repeat protein
MVPMFRALATGALVTALWLGSGISGLTGSQDAPAATVTLRMIEVTSAEAAERILRRLNAGESFATLARAESVAPSAGSGGWLGPLSIADLRPEVRRALEGVAPGRVTAVIRLPTGFAIFKVEEDERSAAPAGAVSPALASWGAVKFVYDIGGFSDARAALEAFDKPPGWNLDPLAICEARTGALASTRAAIQTYVEGQQGGVPSLLLPVDVMQLYVVLAQLDAYEGRMNGAVTWLEHAYDIAKSDVPATLLQMEQALGVALLHKAGMDNGAYAAPGDACLLQPRAAEPYARRADAERAIEHFRRYLEQKPDELEVRWLLNIAYRTIGGYPDTVPPQHLIPPSAFEPAEDVGRFHDVAREAGLTIFASAGGTAVEDFRNTGHFDVVTSMVESCGSMSLFVNNGDGTFTDRSAESGLAAELGGLNIVPGDYDNDGCQDILVLRGGWEELPQRKSLLRNNCDGTFTDVTVESGLATPATATQTAVWADIDNDGYLDLFVGNENGSAQLFRNRRHGTFEDIAAVAGVNRTAYTKGVAAADYDGDRFPDLYVSNYGGANFLYRNNGDGTFTEFSDGARVLGTPTGFATWFFDYDNDGHPDLFVASYVPSIDEIVRHYLRLPRNGTTAKLYRNLGDGTFRDVTADVGLDRVLMPMGANFGDIDNDGFLDIYLGTGHPSYAALSGSVLLRNQEGRRFVDVTASSGTGELHRGHGVAFADLDHDGDQDIVFEVGGVTPGDRHALRLFENPGHGNDWIAIKLLGVKTNRTAVGARIAVTVRDEQGRTRSIHRTVGTGGSFGASPLEQHIGLGTGATHVDVAVWWPTSDTRQLFTDVGRNRRLQIEEFAERYTAVERTPVRLGGAARSDR